VIRVVVADDHAVVRTGLAELLANADDIELVGSVEDGERAIAAVERELVDVVLMDLSMPGVDGIEATARIRAARPETQVVVLTSFSDRERILDALDAGAVGYLLKDVDPDGLLAGIRAAAAGESPLAPKAARALVVERSGGHPAEALTEREREILGLVASGLANKQIARRLGISEKTVKAHLTSAYRRIGVFDRTQAALWAERHDLRRSR
jgi:DNA-binding NarL/FixJ family response regulator